MRIISRLFIMLAPPIVVGVMTYSYMWNAFMVPVDANNKETLLFEIAPGKSFRDICKALKVQGLSRYWMSIEILSRLRSKDRKIRAGEYELTKAMAPRELLEKLLSGEVFKRTVLVKEGATIADVAKAVDKAGLLSEDEFSAAERDPELLAKAGISASSFEGYLFPDTYFFSKPTTAKDIIWTMLEEGEKRWTKEFSDQADKVMLSRHEILTLASVIEKESGNTEEQPTISSIFHNRLTNGMKLQSDPTVIYGIPNFNGNLTREDLQNSANSYNTYANYGLPPGPIANPGETAVKAALFPTQTTYLFFVADGQGHHVFSTTLAEHNEAVNRFQRNRAPADAAAPNQVPPSDPVPPQKAEALPAPAKGVAKVTVK